MKTKITELFGIEHPIIQGGMHHVGFAELAAAVSNAGGLGTITGLTQGTPEKLADEIARCKEMTDKPFAVNLTFLPSLTPPDYPGLVDVIIGGGVPIVETAGRNPAEYLPALKEAGIKVIHKCTSVRHSLKANQSGVTQFPWMVLSVADTLVKMTYLILFFCQELLMNLKFHLLPQAVWLMREV
jgi:nitronate monooxygenase